MEWCFSYNDTDTVSKRLLAKILATRKPAEGILLEAHINRRYLSGVEECSQLKTRLWTTNKKRPLKCSGVLQTVGAWLCSLKEPQQAYISCISRPLKQHDQYRQVHGTKFRSSSTRGRRGYLKSYHLLFYRLSDSSRTTNVHGRWDRRAGLGASAQAYASLVVKAPIDGNSHASL